MPQYSTLEKLFYSDSSSDRFADHERRKIERLNHESTFRTGIALENGELFLAIPHELSLASEQILRRERRVSALWHALSVIALSAFMRSLVLDEVVYSNGIEGVHSTRREVEAALEAHKDDQHIPFVEFAHLYLQLEDNPQPPSSLADIRSIYDAVVAGTLAPNDLLGASTFRTGPVKIINHMGHTVHSGVLPNAIEPMMEQWLTLSRDESIPELYSAALCHFLFEYIHPFYDGNGRTGRYLLALHLSRPLSQPTALSLSRTIAENKSAYYKAFDVTERPLNAAEGTHFVLAVLDMITQAQEGLIADLEQKRALLERLHTRIDELSAVMSTRACDALFFAAQIHLFGAFRETRLAELASYLHVSTPTARKTISQLEQDGIVQKIAARPPTYQLTPAGLELLRLEGDR